MMAKVYDELIYEDVNYENIAEYALSKCDKYNINKEMYLDLACGTGNCASVIAANKLGLVDKEVKVIVPGGELKVNIEDDGVKMIGNASFICDGTYLF